MACQEGRGGLHRIYHGDVLKEIPEQLPVVCVAPDDFSRPEDLLGTLVTGAVPEVGDPLEAEDGGLPLAQASQLGEGFFTVGRFLDDQVVCGLAERRLDCDAVLLVHRHGLGHGADVLRFPAGVVQEVFHPVGETLVLLEHSLEEVYLRHVLF